MILEAGYSDFTLFCVSDISLLSKACYERDLGRFFLHWRVPRYGR